LTATFTRTLRSDPRELEQLLPELAAFLALHHVEASVTYVVQLSVEELLLNVMKHGYHGETGHSVTMKLDLAGANEAMLEVEDEAEAFDPRATPEPDFDNMLRGGREGGLGVHLVRSLSASLDYQRSGNRNHVRVRIIPLPMPPA
jgi:serine/threonine-protein kinase RsbW